MGSVEVVQVVSVPINQAEIPSADMPLEWVEILSDEPQSQNLIAIEENTPEKGLEVPELEEEVPSCFCKDFSILPLIVRG